MQLNLPGAEEGSSGLPCLVLVHGESYEWSSGNTYDGTTLAAHGNIIVVTINFRLGILGEYFNPWIRYFWILRYSFTQPEVSVGCYFLDNIKIIIVSKTCIIENSSEVVSKNDYLVKE